MVNYRKQWGQLIDLHCIHVNPPQPEGNDWRKVNAPAKVSVCDETTKQTQHERSTHKVRDGVGWHRIAEMHGAGKVSYQVDCYAECRESLTQLHTFIQNMELILYKLMFNVLREKYYHSNMKLCVNIMCDPWIRWERKKKEEPKIMAAEAQLPVRDRTAGRPLKSQASDRVLRSEFCSGKEPISFLCLFLFYRNWGCVCVILVWLEGLDDMGDWGSREERLRERRRLVGES